MASILNAPHWVYVIGNLELGWVKIGFTGDLAGRFSRLQVDCPFKLQRIASWKIANAGEAVKLEKLVHDKVKAKRIRGEWYGLNISDVVELSEYVSGRIA